jgi:hypothetical protein
MLLTFLHPGDLSLWELLMILAMWGLLLGVFVGLPLCLVGFVVYKVVRHRREMSESKSS